MLNQINIMGRIVNDPELKTTSTGVKVTQFRIASERDFTNGGERQTDFVDVVAWRFTAEFFVRNFRKGMPILVSGRLQSRNYTTKEGSKRTAYEILAENLYFCGGERRAEAPAAAPEFTDLDPDDSDLPWEMGDELPL